MLRLWRIGDASPWIPVFFGVMGGGILIPASLVLSAETIAPACPFFRKEKIHPYGRGGKYDAESPERVLLRSGLSARRGLVLCSESLSQGYRLSAASLPCPGRSKGTYRRGVRRRTRGMTVVEGFPHGHRVPTCTNRSEDRSQSAWELCAAQEVPCTQERAFFFTKKASCGNQTACVAESRKSVQT